jgi:hypothetical protein
MLLCLKPGCPNSDHVFPKFSRPTFLLSRSDWEPSKLLSPHQRIKTSSRLLEGHELVSQSLLGQRSGRSGFRIGLRLGGSFRSSENFGDANGARVGTSWLQAQYSFASCRFFFLWRQTCSAWCSAAPQPPCCACCASFRDPCTASRYDPASPPMEPDPRCPSPPPRTCRPQRWRQRWTHLRCMRGS